MSSTSKTALWHASSGMLRDHVKGHQVVCSDRVPNDFTVRTELRNDFTVQKLTVHSVGYPKESDIPRSYIRGSTVELYLASTVLVSSQTF